MKKIPVQAFVDLMHLPKRIALRKIYADFGVTVKDDRKRCNKAWEMLSNALSERNKGCDFTLSEVERTGQPGIETSPGPNNGIEEGETECGVRPGTENERPIGH